MTYRLVLALGIVAQLWLLGEVKNLHDASVVLWELWSSAAAVSLNQ